ncbi:MAG: hypothetical protein HYV97_08465 [Bdellovibrio sp.]|nr:hypothetical protein [Bdellovibrio sp.]
MIHRQSNDPVLIKKISLRIWSLRDEVEARIKEHLAQEGDANSSTGNDGVNSYLQGLISEYTPNSVGTETSAPSPENSPENKPALNLIKGGQDEKSSDVADPTVPPAAAEAPAVSEVTNADDQIQASSPTENPVEATSEAEPQAEPQIAAPQVDPNAPIIIRQKTPAIEPAKLCHGRTVLGEIYMDKMSFFAGRRFSEGQAIVIEFLIPKRFIVNADVVYCRHYSLKSRIISGQKLPYRISVKFTFLKPGERTLLREFLESIEPDLTTIKQEVKPKKPAAESDGLDDLANLDV